MPLVRSEITRQPTGTEAPHDQTENVVYHEISDGVFDPSVGYQSHADEIRTLFSGHNTTSGSTFQEYSHGNMTVKVYDMADPKPRPVRAQSLYTGGVETAANLWPRLIACCLSFYATQNLKNQRGRIFIGPFENTESFGPTVGPTLQSKLVDLGHGLFDIGGENVKHVVWSPTKAVSYTVTTYWCNDQWDVMHSRELKEGSRTTLSP